MIAAQRRLVMMRIDEEEWRVRLRCVTPDFDALLPEVIRRAEFVAERYRVTTWGLDRTPVSVALESVYTDVVFGRLS